LKTRRETTVWGRVTNLEFSVRTTRGQQNWNPPRHLLGGGKNLGCGEGRTPRVGESKRKDICMAEPVATIGGQVGGRIKRLIYGGRGCTRQGGILNPKGGKKSWQRETRRLREYKSGVEGRKGRSSKRRTKSKKISNQGFQLKKIDGKTLD